MRKTLTALGAVVLTVLICVAIVLVGWGNTWFTNKVDYVNQKIDDATNHEGYCSEHGFVSGTGLGGEIHGGLDSLIDISPALCYNDFIHIQGGVKVMAEEIKSGAQSSAQKKQPPLWKEVNDMSDKEQLTMLIDIYTDLQRIKSAEDREKEIDYQITAAKAKLEAFGIVTENLDIH